MEIWKKTYNNRQILFIQGLSCRDEEPADKICLHCAMQTHPVFQNQMCSGKKKKKIGNLQSSQTTYFELS